MSTTVDAAGFETEEDDSTKYYQIYVPGFGTDGSSNSLSSFLRLGASVTNPSTTWATSLLKVFTDQTLGFADDTRQRADGAYQAPAQSLPGVTGVTLATDATQPATLTVAQRQAETAKLASKGGWYDHSDGNRITTTQGDKVEIIRGNYQLIVLGRQDTTDHAAIMDGSGGVFQPNDDTPSNIMRLEWVRNFDGTWRTVEESQKDDVHLVIHGDLREERYGQKITTVIGSEAQGALTAPETYGATADGSSDPAVTSELNDLWDATTGNPGYVGKSEVQTKTNPVIVENTWAESISSYRGSSACRVPTIVEETWAEAMTTTFTAHTIKEVYTCHEHHETYNSALVSTFNGSSHDFRNGNFFELFEGRQESVRLGGSVELSLGAASEVFVGTSLEVFAGGKVELDVGLALEITAGRKWQIGEMKEGASLQEMSTSLSQSWTSFSVFMGCMKILLGF